MAGADPRPHEGSNLQRKPGHHCKLTRHCEHGESSIIQPACIIYALHQVRALRWEGRGDFARSKKTTYWVQNQGRRILSGHYNSGKDRHHQQESTHTK